MNQFGFPLLSVVIFWPLVGGLLALVLGRSRRAARAWTLVVALTDLALVLVLWAWFDYGQAGMQFVDRASWIPTLGIQYYVGLDGVSLWFLLLTAWLSVVAVLASWRLLERRPPEESRVYFFLLLALESGVLGVFTAVDLILFYIFWEAMLLPAYFLIGHWGGERRRYATLKFFLYTLAGSALMLVAILVLAALHYRDTGLLTFNLWLLVHQPLPWAVQMGLLLAFGLAFAVKTPLWPLHGWLADAYVESPAPVTILLAGVLSKMGIYGLLRFCLPLFPDALAAARPWLWALAVVGILYGSLVALAQTDLKRLIAFASLAHMNLLFAGALAANLQGVQGALLYSVSHGLTVTALFVLVDLLEARRGTRRLDDFGGLWKSVPRLGAVLLIVLFAAIGLPGLSGFPGEFTLLVGLARESVAVTALVALGIILGAWYMLDLFRRAFAGPLTRAENRTLPELRRREALILLPLVVLMFVLGILPNLVVQPTTAAVNDLLTRAEAHRIVLVELREH
ncbi:MAG TPA: NADH-quinone oxidoreductase subunit M [Anaerolineae bacterium]|nr:NADH-quinone oxidoreductase subunit M [Anaerolineae bacterium]